MQLAPTYGNGFLFDVIVLSEKKELNVLFWLKFLYQSNNYCRTFEVFLLQTSAHADREGVNQS